MSDMVEKYRDALIEIADFDWRWKGGGSEVRLRGRFGQVAAEALGVDQELLLGWPDPKKSETRAALDTKGE